MLIWCSERERMDEKDQRAYVYIYPLLLAEPRDKMAGLLVQAMITN